MIILFQSGMTIGGTWTYVGDLVPSPTPPATYDQAISFSGFVAGEYVYQYQVTQGGVTHSCEVTVAWSGDGIAPTNDLQSGSRQVPGITDCPSSGNITLVNLRQCIAGVAAPTDSGRAHPASWTLPSYTGDLWYTMVPPSCERSYNMQISIEGQGNGNDAMGVALEVINANGDILAHGSANSNETELTLLVNVPAGNLLRYYIRVVSHVAGGMILTVECSNQCSTTTTITTTYPRAFPNDASSDVANCEMYRLTAVNDYTAISPGGKVLYFRNDGSCSAYTDDTDAAANGVAVGEAYPIAQVNGYNLPSAGNRLAVVRTDGSLGVSTYRGPFPNDMAAADGGVMLFEPYLISPVNDYDVPSANGRVLVVRTS